jgi:hypothetical protein
MKLNQLILPVIALGVGGAFLLSGSQEAGAWTTIGGNLNHGQRDFRIFNNFTGASDNNNQVPDAQFPGYQGADMAIWKGCVEWSSIAHGTGAGDPTQSILGSSGANFDPSFQGSATGIGGANDNVHSQISGSNGGVLAYTETPISDGWRIRYYEGWTWSDGPGSSGGIDLQEVACHEYGHALGLGHSTVGSATMYPSYSGGTSGRSIAADDQAGCQAVYGVMAGNKPTITGLSINGNSLIVTGTNFSATDNQVWFTQVAAGGNGQPIKVTGLTSNGTTITANIPATAGPGDVLVRRNGTAHADLSNPWPTDLAGASGCVDPTSYCGTSPNSAGAGAVIGYLGSSSISANDLVLTCIGLVPNKPGLFFYGPDQTAVLLGEGVRCVSGSLTRLSVLIADGFGTASMVLDLSSPPFSSGPGAVTSGDERNFQFWYRDPAGGPSGFNLSDGLQVNFCP